MSTKPLWEKLQALQCHFTWCLQVEEEVNVGHVLQTLTLKVEHTAYHNRSVYLATRAYLQQLRGAYTEALGSLREAETVLRQEHPPRFSRHALLIYGDYAWIYYRLANYEMVELYLGRVHEICQSLSSPEPYSAQIPEIHAQKGWSLLALGFHKGEEATKCFQAALKGDESNKDYQAGLAISVFASWTHSWRSDLWKEAKSLMEEFLCSQPQNCEIKIHLASLLEKNDRWRSQVLTMEVVEDSLSPEDLRCAARLCKRNSIPQAISVLQQAIALAPGYHLLRYDLGLCYKQQMEGASLERKEEIVAAAIEVFKRAVEANPQSVFSRLELAQMYGEKTPVYAEEMYQNLLEELPWVSKRCRQALYLHWGDFLLHKKGQKPEALEMYKAGCMIRGGHVKERQQLGWRLKKLAEEFEEGSDKEGFHPSTAFCAKPLREKLQALQCHFTWHLEAMEKAEVAHHLKTLALKADHTLYHARSSYVAMTGYLHHLQGAHKEALRDLWEAEDALKQDHLTSFSRHALLIYGNYAWVYYRLANYEMVELYLGRVHEICQSLSSPEPYSAQIPEIHAQKGWSLLALGFRKGEEATKCFQAALKGDESNKDYQAGLAISAFASWAHAQRRDLWKEAVRLMGETLRNQPQNWDAKVYLAILLQKTDVQRTNSLAEEAVQSSRDPEVLRKAAKVREPSSLSRAVSVLQCGLALAPGYHLLHCDLGVCYKKQAEQAPPEEREEILAAAVESFKRAVEMDPPAVSPKLELAKIYREKAPLYAEEIFQNLLEEPQRLSRRGRQALYLHWGDFLLYKKGRRQEALKMYEAGLTIPSGHQERQQLSGRLEALAQMFEEESERDLAGVMHEILHLQPKFGK